MNITAVILTHNSEKFLEKCISSLPVVAEILFFDENSTDNTIKIASKYGEVVNFVNSKDFAEARNAALKMAKSEWVLFIDADEVLSTKLTNEINLISQPPAIVTEYRLKRRDWLYNKPVRFGEVYGAYFSGIARLVKKGTGSWQGQVHEVWSRSNGSSQLLRFTLEHFPHQSLAEFLADINTYSTSRANQLIKQSKNVTVFELLFVPMSKFFVSFICLGGFIDGANGFIYAFLMSFHSFLVRAKVMAKKILA